MERARCFVISPIGDAGSAVRRHADDVFRHLVLPAMERFGIDAQRADHLAEPGRITDQMFRQILDARLGVALLTGHNPNVFYEVAVAQAAAKPVILLAEAGEPLPFDVHDLRSIRFARDEIVAGNAHVEQLARFVAAIERRGWKGESLLERYGRCTPEALPDALGFDTLATEIDATLARLIERDGELLLDYRAEGDAGRLFDGLYGSILYASRAAVGGVVDATPYRWIVEGAERSVPAPVDAGTLLAG